LIDKDILFLFAELAVALAGFSTVIGVLSSRKDTTDLKVNALRLQVMLETCFMVAAAALIPALLEKFDLGQSAIWRVASGFFLCMAIPFEFVAQNRDKNMPNMTLSKFNVNTINWALTLCADLLLVAILINVLSAWSDALYFVALFFQLALAGILFVQFAANMFARADRD